MFWTFGTGSSYKWPIELKKTAESILQKPKGDIIFFSSSYLSLWEKACYKWNGDIQSVFPADDNASNSTHLKLNATQETMCSLKCLRAHRYTFSIFILPLHMLETSSGEEPLDEYQLFLQTLPKVGNWDGTYLYFYQNFWCPSLVIRAVTTFQQHFQAKVIHSSQVLPNQVQLGWSALHLPSSTVTFGRSNKAPC